MEELKIYKELVDKMTARERTLAMFYIIARNACEYVDTFSREDVDRFAKLTYDIWLDFDRVHAISLCDSLVWMVENKDYTIDQLESMEEYDLLQLAYRYGYED